MQLSLIKIWGFTVRKYEKFSNVNWSAGTIEETTLKSNSVYCLFFGSSFNMNYKKAFKEIKRITIKNGFLLYVEP